MTGFFEAKKKASDCFKKTADLAEKLKYTASADIIREAEKEFSEKELMIVTIGEMKRGKSSLLNALLGEKDHIFPVNVSVCTNIVTIVRYGKSEKIEAVIEKNENGRMKAVRKRISRSEIPNYVSENGNPSNFKNVRYVEVEIPNPLLKDGIVFVDTPGVGSLNINHAEVTYGFLPNADLMLFVSDALSGLTETEINFLKKGYKYCKNVVYPLTKKDKNSDYREIMEDNRKKISAALELPADEINVVPISSMAKLRYMETGRKAMLDSSNYEEFENVIWSMVAEKRGEILFTPYFERVEQELFKISESIAMQYQVLESDKEKLPLLVDELNNEIDRLNDLKRGDAGWKKELNEFFSHMQNENSSTISSIKLSARKYLDECVTNLNTKICAENQYNQVYNGINNIISEKLIEMKERMVLETAVTVDRINMILSLNVSTCTTALESIQFTPKQNIDVTFPTRKKSDKLLSGGRKISMGMMGGGKIGMIIGAVFGAGVAVIAGPAAIAALAGLGVSTATGVISGVVGGGMLGSSAGSFLGGAKGCIDAVKTNHDVDVPVVQKALGNHIESSMILVNRVIADGFISLRNEVTGNLERELNIKTTELKNNIDHIKNTLSEKKNDTVKLNELKNSSQIVENYREGLDKLQNSICSMKILPVKREERPVPADTANKKSTSDENGGGVSYNFI